jgi:uncharacterized membrane protein
MGQFRRGDTWHEPTLIEKLWNLTWGLVLVVGLTVLSEFGLHMGYSKTASNPPAVSQPAPPMVK